MLCLETLSSTICEIKKNLIQSTRDITDDLVPNLLSVISKSLLNWFNRFIKSIQVYKMYYVLRFRSKYQKIFLKWLLAKNSFLFDHFRHYITMFSARKIFSALTRSQIVRPEAFNSIIFKDSFIKNNKNKAHYSLLI